MPAKQEVDQAIAGLKELPTAYITDGMSRIGLHGGWLSGLVPRTKMPPSGSYVGRALTVQWAPRQDRGTKPPSLYEIVRTRENEAIFLVTGGRPNCYLLGDNTATAAKVAGFEAILVDGCVRDSEGLKEVGVGILTSCVEGGHPSDLEVVGYNLPVMFRGEWVQPGDIVAADADGAVVFPGDRAPEILHHAQVIGELEIVQGQLIEQKDPLEDLHALLHKKHSPDEA